MPAYASRSRPVPARWAAPSIIRFKLSAEQLERIENASSPENELRDLYRALRFAPPKAISG